MKILEVEQLENILVDILGEPKVRYGNELEGQRIFNCPRCAEENGGIVDNKYNLEITFEKDLISKGGLCNCWKCGANGESIGGSVLRIVKKYGTIPQYKQYKEQIDSIKRSKLYDFNLYSGITIDNEVIDVSLPKSFKKINLASCEDKRVVDYCNKRKIDQKIINKFNIGYIGWDQNNPSLSNRIIIPSYDSFGDLNYYVGRDFTEKKGRSKYKNCDADKKKIIFQESKIDPDSDIILCEGVIDAIYPNNAIALMGKSLKKDSEIYTFLRNKAKGRIIICLDNDTKIKETKDIYKLLNNTQNLYGKIWYIKLNEYKDFGEIFEKEGRRGIVKILKTAKQFDEFELLND